jgi:hypothetical protein
MKVSVSNKKFVRSCGVGLAEVKLLDFIKLDEALLGKDPLLDSESFYQVISIHELNKSYIENLDAFCPQSFVLVLLDNHARRTAKGSFEKLCFSVEITEDELYNVTVKK